MPKTFSAFIEDTTGKVVGFAVAGERDVMLPEAQTFRRDRQKSRAELAATAADVALPAPVVTSLRALPPEPADESPKTPEPGPV